MLDDGFCPTSLYEALGCFACSLWLSCPSLFEGSEKAPEIREYESYPATADFVFEDGIPLCYCIF